MKIVKIISTLIITIALIALMGFQLMSNKEEMAEDAKLATLSAKNIPVKTMTVENKTIEKTIKVNGFLKPETELALISDTQGKIIRIYKEKGDYVNAGSIIAKVDDELLQAQLMLAKANYDKMKNDLETFSRLALGEAITEYKLEEVKLGFKKAESDLITIKRRVADTEIKSPVSGRINQDFIEIGTLVAPGSRICDIISIKKLLLPVFVTEQDVLYINEGDQCEVSINTYSDHCFQGEIVTISDKASLGNQYEVELEITNPDGNPLKAGMYAHANFILSQNQKALTIDRKAISGSIQDPKVFVVENNQVSERTIEINSITNNQVSIKSGLAAGDLVVTDGIINLKDKTWVEVIN
ncbi:MAG: efflux RND transporter periplasmic adaptor subunit [Bacteroidales bacterium]|nr:efflux RND transporter periplasmic adaptor subunit [Bacteroidales bacterium]